MDLIFGFSVSATEVVIAVPNQAQERWPSCAHCGNTGIVSEGGREWRCAKCPRVPVRSLRTRRVSMLGELPAHPPRIGKPRRSEIDQGSRTQFCGVEGCPELTSNKKPFCVYHLDRLGHAETLAHELMVREREQALVSESGESGWRKVDIHGSLARDILSILETQGSQTMRSLTYLAAIDQEALPSYVIALRKAGLVRVLSFSSRGEIVELIGIGKRRDQRR